MRFLHVVGRVDGVGPRQLVNGHDRRGFAVQFADEAVGLRAQFDSRHVP